MGYIRHHAIVVTSSDKNKITELWEKAIYLCLNPTVIITSFDNGYKSFFIPTDGSKEGWAESEEGDKKREELIKLIEAMKFDDGSNVVRYACFYYGDDNKESAIEKHN